MASKAQNRASLFDDDETGEGTKAEITVNRHYAENFVARKQRQELARARELGITAADNGGGSGSSDDESSDDDGQALTHDVDRKIMATIEAIRRKDPRVYDASTTFFTEDDDAADATVVDVPAESAAAPSKGSTRSKKRDKRTAKDVLREQVEAAMLDVDAGGQGGVDAFSEDEQLESTKAGARRALQQADTGLGRAPKVYDDEQAALRAEFLAAATSVGGDTVAAGAKRRRSGSGNGSKDGVDISGDAAADDDLLAVKKRDKAAQDDSESDPEHSLAVLRAYLRAPVAKDDGSDKRKRKHKKRLGEGDDSKPRIAQHADEIADPEGFLSAFVRSNAWKLVEREDGADELDLDAPPDADEAAEGRELAEADDGTGRPRRPSVSGGGVGAIGAEPAGDDADEEALEAADTFEAKYNFRFEDPAGTAIVSHGRGVPIEESLRRPDTSRKEARERRKARKEEERREREVEVKRLMNAKRVELRERMRKVGDVAGNGVDMAKLARALADELDADFDPEKYDAKMAALFGEDYYGQEETEAGAPAAGRNRSFSNGHAAADDGVSAAASGDAAEADGDEEDDDAAGVAPWVFGDGPRPAWAGPSLEELRQGKDGFEGLAEAGGDASYGVGSGGVGALLRRRGSSDADVTDTDGVADAEADDAAVTGYRDSRKDRKRRRKRKVRPELLQEERDAVAGAGGVRLDDTDEILALGFEDVIAGGIKTRFPYTTVQPQDYGLSTEEILLADDKDLNKYVGLKRIAPYRDSEWQVPLRHRKRVVHEIRHKIKEELGGKQKEKQKEKDTAKANGKRSDTSGNAHAAASTTASSVLSSSAVDSFDAFKALEETAVDGEVSAANGEPGDAAPSSEAAATSTQERPHKRRRKHKHKRGHPAQSTALPAAPVESTSTDEARRQFADGTSPATEIAKSSFAGQASKPGPGPGRSGQGHHKAGHLPNKQAHGRNSSTRDGNGVVKLPSGATMKASRYKAYGLG